MTLEEAEKIAGDFLMEHSNDFCWIDATSSFVKANLAKLLLQVREDTLARLASEGARTEDRIDP